MNEATVVKADLPARNGVIHLIDRVLTPPADDVLETARKAGKFSVLVKAIEVAGLTDALSSDGPFTVLCRPTRRSPSSARRLLSSSCGTSTSSPRS